MKRIFVMLAVVALFSLGCASLREAGKPKILEGRIIEKGCDIEHLTSGDCGFSDPRGYTPVNCTHFIHVDYYIVISDGKQKQKVEVTPEEYDGLQKGWLVDVSAKYPYWAPRIKAEKEKAVK